MRLLDAYGIELLLVHRGWMAEGIRVAQGWVPVFLNRNSAVYSRGRSDDLGRVARYYRARGIPFDIERGFDERAAVAASPQWARRHRVQRIHLDQFGAHGARALWRGHPVEGW